jgi:hypothetical protein
VQESLQSVNVDTAQSEAALTSIRQELESIPSDQLLLPRVDVQRSAVVALAVARRDVVEPRVSRFTALASINEFDMAHLQRLSTFSLSAWHARARQVETESIQSSAVVPADIVQRAQELRLRMLRLLEYQLDTDPVIAPRLAYIRSGTGYLDLVNDLQSLAAIYAIPEVLETIETDRRHYREADPQDAQSLVSAIMTALGQGGTTSGNGWTTLVQRSWTALSRAYDEVAAAGRFLFRHDEDVEATYPNLVTVARSRRVSASPSDSEVSATTLDAV